MSTNVRMDKTTAMLMLFALTHLEALVAIVKVVTLVMDLLALVRY